MKAILLLAALGCLLVISGCGPEPTPDSNQVAKELQNANQKEGNVEIPDNLKGRGMSRGGPAGRSAGGGAAPPATNTP
jgi:hypothetical protein